MSDEATSPTSAGSKPPWKRLFSNTWTRIILVLFLACCCGGVVYNVITSVVSHEGIVTICDKETVTTTDSEGNISREKRVYTDQGTFTAEDNILQGHLLSADLFGGLQEGTTYEIEYTGFRFYNMFPNIHVATRAPDHLQDPDACQDAPTA